MDKNKAVTLLQNLLDLIERREEGGYALPRKLTEMEFEAFKFAVQLLESPPYEEAKEVTQSRLAGIPEFKGDHQSTAVADTSVLIQDSSETIRIDIDMSSLTLPPPPEDIRLCLDFGTAMSKATLVRDGDDDYDQEEIDVLHLGEYGDDKDEYMLTSSVYIDNNGKIWFGHDAEEISTKESNDGSRQRMDNIKRWLSEGMIDSVVSKKCNPTEISITYADVILAYLTFFTWAANKALENLEQPPGGYPRNLNRRFAMPCLSGATHREVSFRLRKYLGEAQILADTFFSNLREGICLKDFMSAVGQLRADGEKDYPFVREGITEPLGVAGTLLRYGSEEPHHMIAMVIDVGAGTSDFSIYRVHVDPEKDVSIAIEAEGAAGGISEAGNHLDQALKGMILSSCGITSEHEFFANINWFLDRNIRNYKETLFNEKSVYVSLPSGVSTDLTLDDFLQSPGVKKFEQALAKKMQDILEGLSPDWINVIGTERIPYLTITLTGGGATLPMVKALADRNIRVKGKQLRLVPAKKYPTWLQEDHPALEQDYPRIAVSLGGARKRMIKSWGPSKVMAGGPQGALIYDDPKYRW